jgi:hypothetical protein
MLHNLADAAARRLGRHGFSEARYTQAVDQLIAAYVYWLEEEIVAEEAYSRCGTTRGPTRRRAFAVYFAALPREERAAAEYARCVDEVSVGRSGDRVPLVAHPMADRPRGPAYGGSVS